MDEKLIESQEQNLEQMNKYQSEAASAKSLSDHQINELKKRIEEIEALSQTYKAQLLQQKQLEAQQNQISQNELAKLENTLSLLQSEHT